MLQVKALPAHPCAPLPFVTKVHAVNLSHVSSGLGICVSKGLN